MRALNQLKWAFRGVSLKRLFSRDFWFYVPRPGYCLCCGSWAWLTNERPAYSAYDGAFICEDCAEINDEETSYAWAEYYGGRL